MKRVAFASFAAILLAPAANAVTTTYLVEGSLTGSLTFAGNVALDTTSISTEFSSVALVTLSDGRVFDRVYSLRNSSQNPGSFALGLTNAASFNTPQSTGLFLYFIATHDGALITAPIASQSLLAASGIELRSNDSRLNSLISGTITPSNVPEPASWAMFLGGFGLIGGAMRRCNVKVSFA